MIFLNMFPIYPIFYLLQDGCRLKDADSSRVVHDTMGPARNDRSDSVEDCKVNYKKQEIPYVVVYIHIYGAVSPQWYGPPPTLNPKP